MAKNIVGYDENGPIYSNNSQTPSGSAKPVEDPKSEEPGWFQPGSKSDAAVRGFAQGATLGLAPRISAGVNTLMSGGNFGDRLKQYLAADKAASEAHPVISTVGNIVGGAPSMIASGGGGVLSQVGKQAAIGALGGAGNSAESDLSGIARDAATSGAVSGAMTGAVPALGKVAGMGLDTMRGKASPKAITEAAIEFKNAASAPVSGVTGPKSAQEIQNDLRKTYNNLPKVNAQGVETDVRHAAEGGLPLTGGTAAARGDNVMREMTHGYQGPDLPLDTSIKNLPTDWADLQQIVNAHNVKNAGEAGRTVLGSAAGGAALAGGSTYIGTGGDLDKSLQAAGGGALTGAIAGGRYNAVRNTSKLRMPGDTGMGDAANKWVGAATAAAEKTLPGTSSSLGGAANAELAQAASGDIKEKLNVPSSPFGKISDYLAQSSGSNNPDVQAAAQQAQAAVDGSEDDNAKRKAAMALQSTPEGRAVGNSDSPTRVFEN